ncbi:HAD family hydrolase [Cohnella nanjingensis]|uniref:Haloacid dehalogenase-like hydrolase n=1 Tax=Cohnella nanjingensis TaxID=1387779 RepID=A0A7X0RMS1_9BACL|nr:haloacid dehalogenase-like hydrolase [Cohnella nanjingensis]MBB6670394.1 haloacid dehalogenase-like hydrolase [Cohnella nanjingensis]
MRYALIDWDNTIRRGYTIYGLTDYLIAHGAVPPRLLEKFEVLKIAYRAGAISYAVYTERTCEAFAAAMAGYPADDYRRRVAAYLPQNESAISPDADALFGLLRRYEVDVYLVSGAPADVLRAYAGRFGLRGVFGFELEEDGEGLLTGRVACNYGLDKARALHDPLLNVPGAVHLLGMGDADADLPLLDGARIPIVAGDGALALRFSHDRPWDLGRLEEQLARLCAKAERAT